MKKGKWRISLKSLIWFKWQNHLPRLVIHEKYERHVKWILRILAIIAIGSSLLVFETWYLRLSLAIVLFLIEQFFERSIFLYTSIYVQPLPSFTTESEKWTDMCFAYPINPESNELNVVGPVFSDREYAHNFFNLLRDWNYQQSEDKDNNICLSFVIENDIQYSVYFYPSLKRKTIASFFKAAEEHQKYDKYRKEHQELVMQMIFCKVFRYGKGLGLRRFLQIQSEDKPFWLKPFIIKADRTFEVIWEEEPILKYHFKCRRRNELNKNEVEYQHGKHVIKDKLKK